MSAELGPARHPDLPRLVELLGILFREESEFSPESGKQAAALAMILDNPQIGRIHVARVAGEVVAMVSMLYTVSTAAGGRAAWLEDMVVHPAHRGAGLGPRLLEHALAAERAAGVLRVALVTDAANTRAQRMYARAGFDVSAMRLYRCPLAGPPSVEIDG